MVAPDSVTGSYPLLSFQHGTMFGRGDAPSFAALFRDKGLDGWTAADLFGSMGYVISAPDYLGLGDSSGQHPYCHAHSEAIVSADLLRAVRQAANKISIRLNSKLFLTGYSQGGHATMALHKYLEDHLALEFSVTASTPMGGPYDLSTSWKEVIGNPTADSSAESLYLINSMRMAARTPSSSCDS
jgi:hypothetical protein